MTDIFFIIFAFVFGAVIGSFLNVVIYRLPRNKSLISPPSHCPKCGHQIRWYENIPVLSYLFLAGKCSRCKTKIPFRYLFVEVLTGTASVFSFVKYGISIDYFFVFLFLSLMIALSFIDFDLQIIPDEINLIGFVSGIVYAYFRNGFSVLDALIGAVVGAGFLFLVGYLYFKFRKIEGLGFGDVKLMAFIGTYLGWFGALFTIFAGSLFGAVIGIGYSILKKEKNKGTFQIPFGPFLATAAVIYIFYGEQIRKWYLGG
jgi:leader peptidase (prepilin peptidase)/N-methyltransferase